MIKKVFINLFSFNTMGLLFLFSSLLFSETRVKTVEFNLGGYYNATNLASNTQFNFQTRNIKIPENSINIISAWVEYYGLAVSAVNVNPIVIYFDPGLSATTARFTSAQYTTQSGESIVLSAKADVTSVVSSQISSLSSGVNFTAGIRITGPTSNMHTAKLYITYSYDDESPIQLKTVRFPLYSNWSAKVAVSTGALAPTTTSMWYFADLPDMYQVQYQWVELTGFKRYLNLTNGQISLNMGLTQEPTMYIDSSLRDSFYFRYITSSAIVPGFSTGSLKSVNITTVNDPIHFLSGEVVITYEALNNSTYKVDTVRQFVGQTAVGTSASVFSSKIFLNEEDIIPIEVYSKINGSNDSTTSTNQFTVTASLGGVSATPINYNAYYFNSLQSDWKFIYSFTSALAGFSNGAVVSSTISANASAGGYGMELFVTYKYKNNAAHTGFYGSYAGNNTAVATSYSYNNIPLVWVESGSSKSVNSGYVLGDIIAANLNGDQQTSMAFNSNSPFTMTHRTINESPMMFQIYQNLSQISPSTNSFNVNYQNVSARNSIFNGSAWVNYLYTPPPKFPYDLAQKRADNNYDIPISSWINTGSVNFYAKVSSSKTYDNLALSIELKPNSSSFDGLNLTTSSFSSFNANITTYNVVYVSSSGLISGTIYKWRVRAVGDGGAGQWVNYFSPSFGVDLSSPTPPPMLSITPIDRSSFNYTGVSFSFDYGSDTGGSGIKNYELQVSTKTDFSVIYFSSMPFSTSAFSNLTQNTYYWRVRTYDNAGNIGVWSSTKSFIVDLTQPNILDSQSGDDIWRSTNSGVYYDVGFTDNLSYLNKFQIKVTTGPNQSGTLITDWTDIVTNINQSSYGSWQIPNSVFNLMQNGTNYVSVRVYDNAGNVNISTDVFYVLKDTISPTAPNLNSPVTGSSTNVTNLSFSWNTASDGLSGINGYEIEISTLTDFSVRYSSGYATGLSANFVLGGGYRYYWKVRAKDNAGNFGSYSSVFNVLVDTIPPAINDNQLGDDIWRSTNSGVYYDVGFTDNLSYLNKFQIKVTTGPNQSGTLITDWTDIVTNINQSSYGSWQIPNSVFNLMQNGTNYVSVRVYDNAGNVNISTDVFYVLKDTIPPTAPNLNSPVTGSITNVTNLSFSWNTASDGLSGINGYEIEISTLTDFSVKYSSGYATGLSANFVLGGGYRYYWKVRAKDNAGNFGSYSSVFNVLVDTIAPSINDNQAGDDTIRYINNGTYNVSFNDLGGSLLNKFQIKATTAPNQNGTLVLDWSDVVTNINSANYPGGWSITNTQFDLLVYSTNYISVRVFDNAGNVTVSTDVFYIVKAPNIPKIINNQTGDDVWISSNSRYYDVDFESPLGNITKFEVKTSTLGADWNLVLDSINQPTYTTNWQVPNEFFNLLPNGTNYISIRVWNDSGNNSISDNVFYIKKDTALPQGYPVSPQYSNSYTFDLYYSTFDNASGVEYVNLYYTYETETPYNWIKFGDKFYNSPIVFTSTRTGSVGFKIIAYDNAKNQEEVLPSNNTAPEFTTAIDLTSPIIINNQSGDDIWRNIGGVFYDVDFYAAGISPLTRADYLVKDGLGNTVINWSTIAVINSNSYTSNWQVDFSNLISSYNYVSVRVFNLAGNSSVLNNAFYIKKDTQVPTITDNQIGDNLWRSINNGYYDVDFNDNGPAGLNKFQIKVTTGLNQSGTVISDWTDVITNINQPNYTSNWQIPNTVFDLMQNGTNYVSVRVYDNAGNVFVSTDVFYVRKDIQTPTITNNQIGDNLWRGINNGYYDVDFNDNGPAGLNKFQIKVTTGLNQSGTVISDWTDVITNINQPNYTSNWQIPNAVFDLMQNGTNYVSVRVYDNAGNVFVSTDVFYVRKDIQTPTITDNQIGDNIWRGINNGYYDVDFNDNGPAGLNKFQIKVTTGLNQSGTVISDWTDVITNINQPNYTSNWQIPNAVFDLMQNGTNYVSVRVYDNAGNVFVSTDVFYVLKDTVPPSVMNNQSGDDVWISSNSRVYSVFFEDNFSLLNKFQVKATTGPNQTGTVLFNWTDIVSDINLSVYDSPWSIGENVWNLLSNGTNYISVKVYDNAGNVFVSTDVFYIRKDTVPPNAISNLNGNTGDEGSVNITFSAPFDSDGSNVDSYLVKYSTFFIDSSNFDTAITYSQSWVPSPGGSLETKVISGLEPNTNYYFAVKSIDKAGNISSISNVIQALSGQDNTPPAAITDLNAYPGPYKGSIVLEFTSVGDNGYLGTASYYKVRWRTDTPITNISLWNSATEYYQNWIPKESGNQESFILSGFEQGTTYYLAVRVLDEVFNISSLSNSTFTYASYFPARDGIVLYQNGTGNVPLYSVYLAAAGSFQTAVGVPPTDGGTGATVRHVIVRASPLRKEMMAGILSSDGVLQIMRYDIPSNQWTKEWSTATITTTNSAYRGFDIAYESLSGRCMVLYNGSSAGNLLYNIYDGNNWSGGITLTTGTTQAVAWVRLESNPKTDEIMAVFSKLTSLELYATKWNGNNWTDGFQLRNGVGVTTMQDFDLAWNNTGSKLLAVFGAGNTGYAQTRIYSNGVWSTGPNFTLQGANGTIRYIVAKGDPNSKYIGVTSFDTGSDWNANIFDSETNSFISQATENTNIRNTANQNRPIDAVWDNSSKFIVAAAHATSYGVIWGTWTVSGGWGTSLQSAPIFTGWSNLVNGVKLERDKELNFVYLYANSAKSNDLRAALFLGSSWQFITPNPLSTNVRATTYQPYFFATTKHDIIPPIVIDNQAGDNVWRSSNTAYYNIDATDDGGSYLKNIETIIYAGPNKTGGLVEGWTAQVSTSGVNYYYDDWKISDNSFDKLVNGVNYVSVRAIDGSGNVSDEVVDAFYIKKDTVPPNIPSVVYPINNSSSNLVSVSFSWNNSIDNASGINRYEVLISTLSDFSNVLFSSNTASSSIVINMPGENRYYWKLRAMDNAYNYSDYSSAYTFLIDTTVPSVSNNQSGDDVWISSNSRFYSVFFNDNGGSLLNKFQVKATTGPNQTGTVLFNWTDLVSNINSGSYNTSWSLTSSMFNLLQNGTNYISVRVYDNAGNVFVSTDVFYIRKDVLNPQIINNQTGDDLWRNTNNAYYDVDFIDLGGSFLNKIQIKSTKGPNFTGETNFDWTDFIIAIDSSNYLNNFQLPIGIWNQLSSTKNYISFRVYDNADNVSISTDTFYVLKDTTSPTAPLLLSPLDNSQSSDYHISFVWVGSTDDVSGVSSYDLYVSNDENFSVIYSSKNSNITTASVLLSGGRYYWKVRAKDNAGNYSLWSSTFSVFIDTIAPQITNNQIGDDAWRRENNGFYNVDFSDLGGSLLSKFQVKATTGPNQSGTVLFDWTDLISDINSNSYTADWQISQSMFGLLQEGTNYISVRVFDNAGNVSVLSDVFYIRKDITSPLIYDNQSGDYIWRAENTGLYNVDFYDATSLLDRFEIKITTGLEQTGTVVLDWTAIVSGINKNIYTDNWKIPDSAFNILPVGVNYVSVRAYDNAGNISVSTDVFYIQKDTMPVSIINNETPSHYAVWVNTNSLNYDIDVVGSGASLIDRIEIAVSTIGYNIQPYLIDWTTAVASINSNSYTANWKIPDSVFDGMVSYATNYVSVRAYNEAESKTTLSDAFYVLKDTITPVYQKNISNEYTWTNSSSTYYDIDFIDNQSGIYGFEVLASTNSSGLNPLVTWTNVFAGINEKNFVLNWQLPENVFDSLMEDTTNYISVKVYDVAKNTSTLYDLFKVFKDTTPPSIYDNETGDNEWRGFESGYYNVDFNDTGGSLLKNIMIRVSTSSAGGPYYINWSVAIDSISASSYSSDWQIPLNIWGLINEGTSYIYVGAYDNAGNFKSQTVYAFMVKKDTTPPSVPILNLPADNSYKNNLSIDFSWAESNDVLSGTSYYQIIISTYENFDYIYLSTFSFSESKNINLPSENKWYWKVRAYDKAGNYSAYSSSFSVVVDTTAPQITNNQIGDDAWRRENNGFYNVDFYDLGGSLLSKFQVKATTGPNQSGMVLFDWTDLITNINSNSYTSDWQITQTMFDLLREGTNYISVRVFDNAGNIKISTDAFYVLKDTTVPSIIDNQSGDDNWYSLNPGNIFNIDFNDYSSKLSSASYYSYSNSNKTGILISSGSIFGPNFNQASFVNDWGVDFSKLKEGYNYISIFAGDMAGNTTEQIDAFYIKKDTTSPIIEDLQNGDTNWYNINPGDIFNVRFYDYGIGITTVAIKITTGLNQTGEVLINGSTIYRATPVNSITDKWGLTDYNWSLLKQGTNYVSVYVYDGLNQLTISTDVFYIQKDTTPPSQITNLNAYNNLVAADEGSLYLSWTAGGDDGSMGYAKSYEIRYATYNINSSNFDFASVYVSTLIPKSYGNTEVLKIENLNPGTTYYFALKAVDKAGNKSLISNTTYTYSTPDLTPPYAITDLNAVPGDFTGQIKINWTARGEGTKGTEGTQSTLGYIIKYATYSINSSNFDSAFTYFNNIIPKSPGEIEEFVIEGLTPESTYYIAVKSFDEANNISDISNTTFTYAAPKGARDAVILYSKSGTSTLKYRKYSNAQWSNELDTGISFSGTVRWIVLRSIPVVKDEMIAGVLDSNNVLKIIKYDGVLDVWSDITPTPNPTPGNSLYRNFDLAVEQNSARVMFAYYNGTAGSINYAIYSSTANSWVIPPTQLSMASLTGQIYWVKLKSDFDSNKIAVSVLDANSYISANIWNGSTWIDARNLTTAASASAYEAFDISWESQTGDLLALWGSGTTTNFNKWYSTGTWGGNRTGPAVGVAPYWVRLCSSPNSNKIGFTSIYGATRWNVAIWRPTGAEGWSALPTADTAMSANNKRTSDCAWQSKTEQFISIAVDNLGTYDTQFDWITWNNGTWSPASPSVTTANTNTTFSSDIKWTSLLSDPDTDNVMAWAVDTSNNLRSTVWSGSLWAASGVGSNFYHGVVQDYNYESFAIEFKRKDNIPPTILNNQSGDNVWRNSNYQSYSVFANDTGGSLLKEIQTKIYTGGNGSGVLVQNWTSQVQNINSSSYSLPWQISDNTFNLLHNGATNYVWVRAVDNAGNVSSEIPDAFYIKKDTVPPTITSHISSSSFNFWTSTGVGLIDIDFSDAGGSNISTVSYSVWTSTNMTGIKIADNVLISSEINKNTYNEDWSIDFSILSNGTNYISVTVWDNAGSSHTLTDAFKVLKDTIPPSQITNLSAQPGPLAGTVLLTFSAPGDDNAVGNNTQGGYIIKYATFNIINNALFDFATSYNETFVPSNKGETENIVIYGLNLDTTYYFAIKSYDKAGNISLISNSTSSLAQKSNVFINEVYPSGSAGEDWIELYNNTSQNFNLNGWKLVYRQGPVDGPGSDLDIWTGASTDTINAGGVKLINISFDLNSAQSYSVILKNSQGKIIDAVQWPVISNGQSFSRIYDGSTYFEIDPTPTQGYKNSISTSSLKINEVSYKNWKFVEIYNSTNSNVYINNYSFRGVDNMLFRFNRNIQAYGYSMIDQSSFSEDNYSFADIFSNLNENGGFLVLENESGQTIDRVSWKGGLVPLYNYKAQSFVNGSYAPSGSNSSIARLNDGYDTDDDGLDFSVSSVITPLYRNSNYGLLGNNDIYYPVNNGYLSSRFPINIKLNRDYSAGYNDIIAFINTDGKDKKSPHIYRLLDLGFDLSSTLEQKEIFDFDNFYDIDGNKLVSNAVYKILFITDSSTSTSAAIWITSVTADNSNILVNGYDTNNLWLNPNKQVDIFKITAYNPAVYDLYITSISLNFKTTDYQNLTTEQLKNLIKNIKLIKDSNSGNIGIFEEGIDIDEISNLSNSEFVLNNGKIEINISTDNLSLIPSKSTSTYFVVFVSSDQSYDYSPNQFISKLNVSVFGFSDWLNLVTQKMLFNQSYIETSSLSVISPGADTVWSLNTNIVSNIETNVNYWNNVYISANDGVLRTLDYNTGNEKWAFITSPLSPIKTSPLVSISEGGETYIYIVAANGDVYKIRDDDTSYSQIWKTNINDMIKSDLYDSDTSIYFGTQNNKILCLNKSDGNVCDGWSFDNSIDSSINTDFSIDFRQDVNMGWVGLLNGKVLAFRLSDGVVLNQFQTGGPVKSAPFIDSAYSMASNNLFIASTDGKLYSRVASNLNVVPSGWTDAVLSSAVYSSPYKPPYKNYILVGDESGRIYKIDSVTGSILKTFFSSYPVRSMPVEFNGWVYFASGKYIYALDETNFNLKPGYPIYVGSEVKGNLILDSYEGYLFFSTNAGGSYTIDLW